MRRHSPVLWRLFCLDYHRKKQTAYSCGFPEMRFDCLCFLWNRLYPPLCYTIVTEREQNLKQKQGLRPTAERKGQKGTTMKTININFENKTIEMTKTFANNEERRIAEKTRKDYLKNGESERFFYYAIQQLRGRSIKQHKFLMFNQGFLEEVKQKYLWSLADDLEGILFNHLAEPNEWETLCSLIDVAAYQKEERIALKQNWGKDEACHIATVNIVYQMLEKMYQDDRKTIDSIVDDINQRMEVDGK